MKFPLSDLDMRDYLAESAVVECSEYDLYAVVHHVGALSGGHYVLSARSCNVSRIRHFLRTAVPVSVDIDSHAKSSIATDDVDQSAAAVEAVPPSSGLNNSPVRKEISASSASAQAPALSMSDTWWCFNDNSVTRISEQDVVSSSAYLLFYVRKDVKGLTCNDLRLRQEMHVPDLPSRPVTASPSSETEATAAEEDKVINNSEEKDDIERRSREEPVTVAEKRARKETTPVAAAAQSDDSRTQPQRRSAERPGQHQLRHYHEHHNHHHRRQHAPDEEETACILS